MRQENLKNNRDILLETRNLSVEFPMKKKSFFEKQKMLSAVSDVSIQIRKGETFGLVGESGCGKSTFANATLGFVKPRSGEIYFNGQPLYAEKKTVQEARLHMQKIFQDPASSLNPRFTVREAVCEPMRIRGGFDKNEVERKAREMITAVGLTGKDLDRYTSQFSGGQQQRIAIARALILNPEYIVCDEPVSALDVSVHAQILNLLMEMQEKTQTTYLFISHNLAAVKKLCSRLAIMYLGKVVEYGDAAKIFANPVHPYTKALLSAVLTVNPNEETKRIVLKGDVTSQINPPSGCRFCSRCYQAQEDCADRKCVLTEVEAEHFVACPVVTGLKADIEQ